MSKRTLAILLIVLGGAAVLGILIWTFYPLYQQHAAQQPPSLPNQVNAPQFQASSSQPSVPQPNTQPTQANPDSTQQKESVAQEQLKQRALNLAGRLGSYSNIDRFESLRVAALETDAAFKTYLNTQREDLLKAHPNQNGSWSQATRALSARITAGAPIATGQKATIVVQAQVTTNDMAATPPEKTEYKELTMEFTRIGGAWLVSRVEQKPIE